MNSNTALKSLYFNGNCLCDSGIQPLTNILLLNNSELLFLNLQNIGITDTSIAYIVKMLKKNTTLTDLLPGYNEISDQGIELLTETLTYPNITHKLLSLHYSRLVGDSDADYLVEMLKQNKILRCLNIYDCSLSEKGRKKLCELVRYNIGLALNV